MQVVFQFRNTREDLREVRGKLYDIQQSESMKLFRLARRMEKHGCSEKAVAACREEAFEVMHLPEYELLNPFRVWDYAFKF